MNLDDSATVIVATASYPYDVAMEQTFLDAEVEALAQVFGRVVLLPETAGGTRLQTPSRVEVEEAYARDLAAMGRPAAIARAMSTTLVFEDAILRMSHVRRPAGAKRLLHFAARAALARSWLCNYLRQQSIDPSRCLVYTFWWTGATAGFGLAKESYPGLRVVTRAMGSDLYEERHDPPYLPCRRVSLRHLDAILPVSQRGHDYLVRRYRPFLPPCETFVLGVPDAGGTSPSSNDRVFRIVSCSLLVPVKRVELLVTGIARASNIRPGQRFSWTHFGTGPLKETLVEQARTEFGGNVTATFAGYTTQADLFSFYRTHPVDVFAHVSSSEGGVPVAAQEAASAGIPILATDVGGNPEIATSSNGILLSADPDPDEVARALLWIVDHPEVARGWRDASRALWRFRYVAGENGKRLAFRLRSLLPASAHPYLKGSS